MEKHKYNELKLQILLTLAKTPGLTAKEIAQASGTSIDSVKNTLSKWRSDRFRKKYIRANERHYPTRFSLTKYGHKTLRRLIDHYNTEQPLKLHRERFERNPLLERAPFF